MIKNIIERFVELCNRYDRHICDQCNRHIQERKWAVLNEPVLYSLVNIFFGGIVTSAIFLFVAVWRFGEGDWFAVPLLLFALPYFAMEVYLNRKYKNRV